LPTKAKSCPLSETENLTVPLQLYIIRHAQSANNALSDQSLRVADPALTPLGIAQSEALAEYIAAGDARDLQFDVVSGYSEQRERHSFGITHLYCSAMHRALLTTQPLASALKLQPQVWLDIHEEGGVYLEKGEENIGQSGKRRAEIAADFPTYQLPDDLTEDGWWGAARGYESREDAFARAALVADTLRARAESDDVIALVTHGTFIDRLLKMLLGHGEVTNFYYLHFNTAITRIDFMKPDRVVVRYLNRADHLPPHLMS
jgi:2,3-bisphosphoglycerate-dependent phosphoglycerate mutase